MNTPLRSDDRSHRAYRRSPQRSSVLFGSVVSLAVTLSVTLSVGGASAAPARPLKADSLSLEDLLSCARQNNPAWELAHSELESAYAKLNLAELSALPSMKLSGALAPLPARRILRYCLADDGVNVTPCPNQEVYDDQRLDQVDGMGIFARAQLTLQQPLYTFGKISNGRDAARAGVDAYKAGLKRAERSLDLQAAQTYFGLQLATQLEKTIRKGHARLKKLKAKIQSDLKAESGKYTSNDLRRTIIQEGDIISRGLEVEALKRQAIESIRVACELPVGAEIALDTTRLKALRPEPLSLEALKERARAERLDVQMARAQVMAREALASKAISDLLPDLALIGTLGYSLGTSAEDHPDPFANDPFNAFGYGFYLGLNWNLSVAKLKSGPREAEAALEKARAQLRGLEMQLELELIEHGEQLKRYEGTLKAKKEAMRAAKQWLTASFISLGSGLITSGQAIRSISAYLQATASYDQAVYEYNLATLRLWRATGLELKDQLAPTP